MSGRQRNALPEELADLVDSWIAESGITGPVAADVRDDLERHFLDGLAAGRSNEELVEAFGDPAVTAPMLERAVRARAPGRGSRWSLDSLVADVRFSLRVLRSSPVYALTVVVVLALGIGANAVTFTILNEVLLKPLPISDQGAMVNVLAEVPGGNSFTGFSIADFETLRDENDVLVDLGAMSAVQVPLGEETSLDQIVATLASPNYFDLLGVPAALGTVALPTFTGWGVDQVAVVSHGFWRGRLAGDPAVVGSTLRLDGRPVTVIGVAAEGFTGTFIGFPTQVWLPMSMVGAFRPGFDPADRSQKFLELLGRRRPGVSVADADVGLDRVASSIERAFPDLNRGHRVRVVQLSGLDDSLRVGVMSFVAVLMAVALLVLLVACLNVGSILLVRTMSRERELAVRIAVGAGSGRLVRQLLTETAIVTGLGALVALLLATRSAGLLSDFVATMAGGLGLDLAVDWRVLLLTVGAALLAAVTVTVVPALHLLRKEPAGVLRQGQTAGRAKGRARGVLVVGQVALSVLLVVSAGLFVRALGAGLATDPGFDADRVASVAITLDPARFDEGAARALRRDLVEEVRALPGVTDAAWSFDTPIGVGTSPTMVSVPGVDPPPGEIAYVLNAKTVGAGYFRAVGIELLSGAAFTAADDASSVRTAVVSVGFAERFFDGGAPVGQSIVVDESSVRVVGVAENVRYMLQDDTPDPLIYLSTGGAHRERMMLLFRSSSSPHELRSSIQAIVARGDPAHGPVEIRTVREALTSALLPQRVGAVFIGTMGVIALLLATVGLYGLVQYSVGRDVRALGIRMALGSGRRQILASVLRGGFALVSVGLVVGVGGAFLVTPSLSPFLIGVPPSDPLTYVSVVGLFAIAALGATILPALRASRIDPAQTLRSD